MMLEVGELARSPLPDRISEHAYRIGKVIVEVTATARLGTAGDKSVEDGRFPCDGDSQAVRLAVQSPCQATVDVKERTGDRTVGELKLLSGSPTCKRKRHFELTRSKPEGSCFQAELIVADVVAEIVIQQSYVVAATATPVQLREVEDVGIERIAGEDEPLRA